MAQGAFLFGEYMGLRVYNLKGLREAAYGQTDWAPSQDNVAEDRVNEFVDRGLAQMSLEAPALFFEDEVRWAVHQDRVPTLTTDLLEVSATGDAWVLQTELSVGTTDALVWETDRLWWGRNLLLKVPSSDPEEWHMVRIREVWTETINAVDFIRVSLEKPWRNITDTGIEYRVLNNEFTLPDDIIEVRSISLMESSTGYPYPLSIIGQNPAEFATFPNQSTLSTEGVPRAAYRREAQAIDGPRRKPGVEIMADNVTWTGPEDTGEFEYLITYTWGTQEVWAHTPGPEKMDTATALPSRQDPYWESAPSPVSDTAVIDATTKVVRLHLPNMDHMLGFDDNGTARYQRTGIRKRVYRRRKLATGVAAAGAPLGSLAYPHQDAADRFYYMDDVTAGTTEWVDDGSVIPDLNRPLREVHNYQTFRLYPRPDDRYDLVLRYIKRPLPLQDDYDVPHIPRDACEALILRTCAYLYEMQGDFAAANRKLQEYERAIGYLLKRYGDMRPAGRLHRRRIARVKDRSVWRRDLSGVVRNA